MKKENSANVTLDIIKSKIGKIKIVSVKSTYVDNAKSTCVINVKSTNVIKIDNISVRSKN